MPVTSVFRPPGVPVRLILAGMMPGYGVRNHRASPAHERLHAQVLNAEVKGIERDRIETKRTAAINKNSAGIERRNGNGGAGCNVLRPHYCFVRQRFADDSGQAVCRCGIRQILTGRWGERHVGVNQTEHVATRTFQIPVTDFPEPAERGPRIR